MRTKTIENLVDRIFWALVLMFPIIVYLIGNNHNTLAFIDIMNQFNILDSNIIYTGLVAIFGSGGYLEFIDTTSTNVVLLYMSYFVVIELIHIFVDVILFVPKICVNILDKYSNLGGI